MPHKKLTLVLMVAVAIAAILTGAVIMNAGRAPGDRAAPVAANPSPATSPSSLLDPQGNVVLFVTNQSIALGSVDIAVEIDGREVVDKRFRVGSQHTFERFVLRLPPGRHILTARSAKGRAEVTRSFHVAGKRWIAVAYWYSTEQQGTPEPRQIDVRVSDQPMLWD